MTTQITWNMEQLERSLPDGLVLTAHWRVTGIDGQYSGTAYGSLGLPANDPTDPGFVPYEQITKEQAISWVKEAMGEEQVAAHEANIISQIEKQKAPATASGTPWN